MTEPLYVRWFDSIRLKDLAEVGGKNASLGELHALLAADDDRADGFVLTARAYREALDAAGAWGELRRLLSDFDHHDVAQLAERAAGARQLVYEATGIRNCAPKSRPPTVRSRKNVAPTSRSLFAARPRPRTCRQPVSPASTKVF